MRTRLVSLVGIIALLCTGIGPPDPGSAVAARSPAGIALTAGPIALAVDHTGMYRLSGAWLRAHGVDWDGIPTSALALVSRNRPVARLLSTAGRLDDRTTLIFYGQAADTRYTTRAIYYLRVDPRLARAMPRLPAVPGGGPAARIYLATYVERRRRAYDPLAPGDGWFYDQVVAAGGPSETVARFVLPGLVRRGTATIAVRVRGVSALPGTGPQHHVIIVLNGRRPAEIRFSGTGFRSLHASLPAAWLRTSNRLRLLLPGDVHNADQVDAVDLETFVLRYPRRFEAENNRLAADLGGRSRVSVGGYVSAGITVWRTRRTAVQILTGTRVQRAGSSYHVSFAAREAGTYRAIAAGAMLHPAAIWRVHPTGYLTRGRAGMLVIAPRAFIPAIMPLVSYHQRHGLAVKVAVVEDVYTHFGDGSMNPDAIRKMIDFARVHLGTRLVLLIGGDTYDPRRYLSCRRGACPANPADQSVIPSFYVRDTIGQVPSDERYVAGKNGLPLLGIGRIPALNRGQVARAVTKTIAVLRRPRRTVRAVLSSGGGDPTFAPTNDALSRLLPSHGRAVRADTARLGVQAARRRLLTAINSGASVVSFVGHGNLEEWGNPPALLSVQDVQRLRNPIPALFLGWGCQTAYDIDPTDEALNARLLFARHGAVLTIGSTGIDPAEPQAVLAEQFFRALFRSRGVSTVGGALRLAEARARALTPDELGLAQTYELFGDPALPLDALW